MGFKILDSARSPTLLSSVEPTTEPPESNFGALQPPQRNAYISQVIVKPKPVIELTKQEEIIGKYLCEMLNKNDTL